MASNQNDFDQGKTLILKIITYSIKISLGMSSAEEPDPLTKQAQALSIRGDENRPHSD